VETCAAGTYAARPYGFCRSMNKLSYFCEMDSTDHHRTSYRLRYHNYAETRAYHITICSHERALIFGEIIDARMHLFGIGRIIDEEIRKTGAMRSGVTIDTYAVMPNHVHLILILTEESLAEVPRAFEAPKSGTVSSIINGFKASCTSRARKELGLNGIVIWQGRFHDRVIRDEEELQHTREYIRNNPGQWQDDHENPANIPAARRNVPCRDVRSTSLHRRSHEP